MSRKRLYASLLGLLATLVALVSITAWTGAGEENGVPVFKVGRGRFVRRVPAQGNLRAVHAMPIAVPPGSPVPYRIGWLAQDGARVKGGEVVVRFDNSDLVRQLTDARDDARSAGLKIRKQQIEGRSAVSQLDQTADLAREELESAGKFQKKDALVYSRNEIIEAEIDRELATKKEAHSREAERTQKALSGTELDLLAIERRKAELKIHQSEQAMSSLEVRAPYDGVLVLKRDFRGDPVRVGDTVWSGQPLAEIPDLAAMQAEVFVLEADAGGLAPGKTAEITLESQPDAVYPATIQRVDTLAKPRLRGSPVQYFAVTLKLAGTDPKVMKPGQRIRAVLSLDDRPDALTVPRQAVFEREGKTVVYRRRDLRTNAFEPAEVTLGPSGAGRVVVEKGIAPGDVLALTDPTRPREEPGQEGGEKKPGPPSAVPPAGGSGR
jgi:RND family efflux transporter MFP subunit